MLVLVFTQPWQRKMNRRNEARFCACPQWLESLPPGAAEGDGLTEGFGLNSLGNLSLNLWDGVGLGAGLAVALGCVFLRERLASGDTPGDSVVTGEVGVSAGEAVVSTPFCWRLFFGGEGDWAGR